MSWQLYKVPSLRRHQDPHKVPGKPIPHAQNRAGDGSPTYNIFAVKIEEGGFQLQQHGEFTLAK